MNGLITFRKRRAVSEVIGTMMILAGTVAGAVILSNMMSDQFFAADQTPVAEVRIDSLRLTGYDSRDSVKLTSVPNLNNTFNQFLCTGSGSIGSSGLYCSTLSDPDNLPSSVVNFDPDNQGTDFIVLQVRNMNVDSVFLHNILINNEGHIWDDQTANQDLILTANDVGNGDYPLAGKFSIIPLSNILPIKQRATNEILGDAEVRLVIKLSENIPQDIGMWNSLRVLVNYGGPQPAEFIILIGVE